jgi:hypothetical protein
LALEFVWGAARKHSARVSVIGLEEEEARATKMGSGKERKRWG